MSEPETTDRNCMTYWLPRLAGASVPIPKTVIIDAGDDWLQMIGFADGPKQFPEEHAKALALIGDVASRLAEAAPRVGTYPVFLRTGHFSGKHDWKRTCFVPSADAWRGHVAALVEMSELVGMFGECPYRFWAVREMLPTKALAYLPAFGDFPLVSEIRAFVSGGKLVCAHPYWPAKAIRQGFRLHDDGPIPLDVTRLIEDAGRVVEASGWLKLVQRVADTFADDGAWSVDVLSTERGWYVTDVAVAASSFHWEGCERAEAMKAATGPESEGE